MRIVLETGTAYQLTRYELAADGQVEGFAINQQRGTQLVAGLRWEDVVAFDRGNIATEVSFTVHKQHADANTAERYVLGEANRVPARATAYFYVGTNDRYKLWLENAVVDQVGATFVGVTSIRSFRITGGKMQY